MLDSFLRNLLQQCSAGVITSILSFPILQSCLCHKAVGIWGTSSLRLAIRFNDFTDKGWKNPNCFRYSKYKVVSPVEVLFWKQEYEDEN